MRKGAIASIILIIALLPLLTVANLQMASGNPTYIWDYPVNGGVVAPDNQTKPPTIQFYSENNSKSRTNYLSIPSYHKRWRFKHRPIKNTRRNILSSGLAVK